MAGALPELNQFLRATGMPSVTTLKAMGSVDKYNPAVSGHAGHARHASGEFGRCNNAILLVCLGARFDDRVTGHLARFAPHAKVIHLDIDPAEINKLRAATVAMCGDLKQLLPAMTVQLDNPAWRNECAELKHQFGWRYDHPGERILRAGVFAPSQRRVACEHDRQLRRGSAPNVGGAAYAIWLATQSFVQRRAWHHGLWLAGGHWREGVAAG